MKVLYALSLFALISCSTHEAKIETKYEKIDSIIYSSKIILHRNDSINREGEKVITQKINKTVAEIKDLREEAKTAKLAIKTIVRVDTIYIETKKNFWGKTKTNTTIKSDSTQTIDSLENK